MVYYNEFDPFAAAWLRELIKEGVIADGEVDTRDVKDVTAADVKRFDQCHFFAGIGGWSYALRLAGWPDDRPVWTGSCPCQPFSAAGVGIGGDDPRHLWPAWFRLIGECRPAIVFGEQVAAAVNHGWLDLVFDDLEGAGYACGAVDLPACSVGAFHIRQRLWFVADAQRGATERHRQPMAAAASGRQSEGHQRERVRINTSNGVHASNMADTDRQDRRSTGERSNTGANGRRFAWRRRQAVGQADSDRGRCEPSDAGQRRVSEFDANSSTLAVAQGDSLSTGLEGLARHGDDWHESGRLRTGATRSASEASGAHWRDVEWIACRDGKARPTQPGLFPLAHGVSNRVGTLRGAGNAIVPELAAEVIRAYMDACG